jgi:hypothetical protein
MHAYVTTHLCVCHTHILLHVHARYMPALELAKRRDLEMIVANADFCAVLPSGSLGHMPGAKPV